MVQAESLKKAKPALGVSDSKYVVDGEAGASNCYRIGQAIAEVLSIKCDHTGVVPELVRKN